MALDRGAGENAINGATRTTEQVLEQYRFVPVFLIAVPLYGMNLDYGDLWNDETFTKQLVSFPMREMLGLLTNDYHPPLYFIALKLFVSVFGSSAVSLRAFSAIAVIATLAVICRVGSRVLGKQGALLLCLVTLALPMQATFAHTARMYTWASFATTGVFLYALDVMKAPSTKRLAWLSAFTLLGAYIHYYCILSAFCAHLFVFLHWMVKKDRIWKQHLVAVLVTVAAFLPWVLTLLYQIGRVQQDFHQPPVSVLWVVLCYVLPYYHTYYPTPASNPLLAMSFLLSLVGAILILRRKESENRVPLALALVVFHGTVLVAVLISFALRPILFYRYMATMMVLLAVPPALFFLEVRHHLTRRILLAVFLGVGLYAAYDASKETLGPYRATLRFIKEHHPEVAKVLHPTELTVGPALEYNSIGPWMHYWLANDKSVFYTNLRVYRTLRFVPHLDEMLKEGELFCMIGFVGADLNRENFDHVLSRSELLAADTVDDDKATVPGAGVKLEVYTLRYHTEPTPSAPGNE